MSNKIMFFPVKEVYNHDELIIYMAKFILGFFEIKLRLLKSELAGLTEEGKHFIKLRKPALAKKYINVLTIGLLSWIWFTSDNYKETEFDYRGIIKQLKLGDEVEFKDLGEQSKPIKVSWRGIQFHW